MFYKEPTSFFSFWSLNISSIYVFGLKKEETFTFFISTSKPNLIMLLNPMFVFTK